MSTRTAVVCGASMSGLLVARVLADVFDSVSVVERDVLPDGASQRPGVPQGHHLHQLLSSGVRVMERFFPDLLSELQAGGAPIFDASDLSLAYVEVGGHTLCRRGSLTDPDALPITLASRPLLESVVRERVRALPNVAFIDGRDVIGPVLSGGAVRAVQISDRNTGTRHEVPAALMVDAGGDRHAPRRSWRRTASSVLSSRATGCN